MITYELLLVVASDIVFTVDVEQFISVKTLIHWLQAFIVSLQTADFIIMVILEYILLNKNNITEYYYSTTSLLEAF